MNYINTQAVPLSLAVFLATDNYDYNDDPFTISATSLLKPLRQLILGSRASSQDNGVDLSGMLSSRMGNAIHDAVERSWVHNYKNAMAALRYPKSVIDRVVINPENPSEDQIAVYLEQRSTRKVGKWTISGKFDFVGDGRVEDFKSTSVFTAIHGTKDEDYIWQLSIYRWLNPNLITQDEGAIQWIFTDWVRAKAMADKNYPQNRHVEKIFPLKTIQETDSFIKRKLELIERYWDAPEDKIPECSIDELWQSDPTFKYYKDPTKTARSTKNFDNKQEAYARLREDGGVGLVKEVPGTVKACKYCPGFGECTQKDRLIYSGALVL